MRPNQFVGTWRLVSWEMRNTNGYVSYPYGKDAIGYLIYTEEGYMSVMIMSANRPRFASNKIFGGTTEERAAATETYMSYGGKYEIKGNQVIHRIEVSIFPNWVGLDQKRFFEFRENQLLLSTPTLKISDQKQTGHLIWQRQNNSKLSIKNSKLTSS
ncbi:MAG: lipocalin-like domain-containing protein [Symploca sp. SIO3E6]|nr:lipocalin-like domain-containing protein [Caldora sp. SIO3E6]